VLGLRAVSCSTGEALDEQQAQSEKKEERMTRAGYKYEIIHASPETGLDGLTSIKNEPCDGVLIGGAVVGDPAMSYFGAP
jgi:hypothetical protein